MKSSLSLGSVDEQSASLPVADGRLAQHLLRRLAPRLPGAGGEDGARRDRLAGAAVLQEPLLEGGAHDALDGGGGLDVVEPLLGLALELGVLDVDREHRDDPLADVLRGEGHPLGLDLLRLHEGADGLGDRGVEAVLVGAAGGGGDAVGVGADVLVGALGPLEDGLQPHAVLLGDVERRGVRRRLAARGDQLGEVVGDAVGVDDLDLLAARLVPEDDGEPAVQVGLGLEPLPDPLGVQSGLFAEDLRVGPEMDDRPVLAGGGSLFQLAGGDPARERLGVLEAVAEDAHVELDREGVDDARPDAVKAAGDLVAGAGELAAGVEGAEDELQRGPLVLGVDVDGDAAAVVGHRGALVVGVEGHLDALGVAVDDLVDGVVDDLPEQVVVAARVGAADVHRRPGPHRLEALEDLDVLGGVRAGDDRFRRRRERRHLSSPPASGPPAGAAPRG